MTPETKKIAQDFEKRLLEVVRGYVEQRSSETAPYIKADVTNLLVKFFIENKFMTPIPRVNVEFVDSNDPTKIRIDLINPKTNNLMGLEEFMDHCQWTALKERK